MYCSNCEKPSNLSLCKQCQKEFQEIEDEVNGKNLWNDLAAQDQAEYESERDYMDEELAAQFKDDEMDRLYELQIDRWYAENGY